MVTEKIQAIRGMNDVLPIDCPSLRHLEDIFAHCLAQYGYQEIRFPIIESTQLFKRSIGEVTDIVEKEMYTFNDLNGDSLTLRPEGTAGCLRACLEHGLLYNQQQKLWYMGPMFRHERPQKGRYRQFHQFGVEALGISGVDIELELILICHRLWSMLGIEKKLELQINTLGQPQEREQYKQELITYLQNHETLLDEDSKRRLHKNPLRILDSKSPQIQEVLKEAPTLIDCLGDESRALFNDLCSALKHFNISYIINPRLVRGLDYYGHMVFEWVTNQLGAQATVCAGGRYDSLVLQLGGESTPATGFAIGVERLYLLLKQDNFIKESSLDIYVIAEGFESIKCALKISEQLRDLGSDWKILTNAAQISFKNQFKRADKSGAKIALILGEEELQNDTISVKPLRTREDQITISQQQLFKYLQDYFSQQ